MSKGNENENDKKNRFYLIGITLVATLGGLLFGYDTAVISGAVSSLQSFFIDGLNADSEKAIRVVIQFRIFVSIVLFIIGLAISGQLLKLFGKKRGYLSSFILLSSFAIILAVTFLNKPLVLTEGVANSLKGFTISSALVGCIIGGSLAGFISMTIGRKKGLIIAASLFILSAIGSSLPEYFNFAGLEVINAFIVYRVIGGIGVGMASMLSPMYIAEIAPAKIRGKLVSLNQFAIIFGMLVVYFVNYFIAKQGDDLWLSETGWRWMFASETIPATIFLILLIFVPETPRFLVMKNKSEKAMHVLQKLTGQVQAAFVIEEIKESLKQKSLPWLSFGGLIIVIGILISVFQQFVGINVVLYYAPEIFRNMGSATDTSLLQTIIVGTVNLTFTVIAILTVDRFGRKPLMIIGALGMAFSMFALGMTFYFKTIGISSLIFMLTYTAAFAVSWGPVAWVILSEIFPNSIRGAMSIAVAAQWIANLAVSWTFPMMNDNTVLINMFNYGFSYWIYGIMGILAALFIWKIVPETKGKTLEDMDKLWNRK